MSIAFRGPTGTTAQVPSLPALREALAAIPKRPGRTVTVEAAADLKYAQLIAVLDVARKAGLDAIHIAAARSGPM
jgi:biopolymer transport protein ExbD